MAGQLTGLHAKFTGDSTSFQRAAMQATMAVRKMEAETRRAKDRAEQYAASSEGVAKQLHKLRMETDNAYAGLDRFRRASEIVTKAATAQKWSADQLNAELQRLATHYGVAEKLGYNMNDQIRAGRFHTANLAAQFNDIGVMIASGQSPFILAIQQGTQMSQVLANMGGNAKTTGKALWQAFTSILSPVSLLTIGLIAGAATLGQWVMETYNLKGNTIDLDKALGDLADTQSRLEGSQSVVEMSLGKLIAKYGRYALEAREAAMAVREFAIAEAQSKLENQIIDSADELTAYAATMDAATASAQYLAAEQAALNGTMLDGVTLVSGNAAMTEKALRNMMRDLKITREQAIPLADAFREVKEAASLEEKIAAFASLRAAMAEAGVSSKDLPLSIKLALGEAEKLRLDMMELAALQEKLSATSEKSVVHDRERKNLFHALAGEMGAVIAYMEQAASSGRILNETTAETLAKAQEKAQQTLTDLQQEAELQRLINFYGRDSAEVARKRAEFERQAFVAATNASKASLDLKRQLIAAYDAAAALSRIEYETPLVRAKIVAGQMGETLTAVLGDARSAMTALVDSAPGAGWLRGAISDAATLGATLLEAAQASLSPLGQLFRRIVSKIPPNSPPPKTLSEIYAAGTGKGGGGGGGRADNIASELEQLQKEFMTKEQLEMESYARRQEILKAALEQKLLTTEKYAALMEQVERTHQFAMTRETMSGVQASLSALGQLFQGSKKIGAGIAIANSWLAFTEVLKDPAYVGRPWQRFAAATSALASGMNAVRNIKSAQPGGTSSGSAGGSASSGSGSSGGSSSPLMVNLNTQGGGDILNMMDFWQLLRKLNEVAGDRGYILMRPS